ncbi:sigma-54-dependent Fis family transcriptional regulator [Tabrizicola sp. J26]|uniref:sigma-54-dependent Fis family transcriptional regulator n=1 Tax=Alitabrizicola rongguiensis TaxID=2909234 RepID=UPI001F3F219E|nr:sigma-54-dependent Fis family transcriptional regulator [Tabrizicola rongguiensis]MCF1710329.1 sigma-54-dependent Fis family transcriptional regulator [Tabrizicola rongguiensis]
MGDREHVTEIERALRGQITGRDAIVTDSWRRCVEAYGMDPSRPDPAHIVTEAKLREHREQAERLIATARSGLQALFRQVAGQNYVLLLADAQGVCVDFFGDPRFEDELRQAGLYLGSDWTENLAGTCGVGSCIVTGEAITIHQSDHFGLAHTPLSCTSAPIYDTQGQLTAVLDISLLRSPSPKASQNLAMSLVTASARRVEMANLMAMTRRDWVLRMSSSPEFLEVDPEAAVALDATGNIIGTTRAAVRALLPNGQGQLVGRRLDEVLDLSMDDLPNLMRGQPTEDRVVHLRDGRKLFGHAIAPQTRPVLSRAGINDLPAPLAGLAGPDPVLHLLLAQVARLATTSVPMILIGETGTGKLRLARAIHVCGPQGRPFHAMRCATMTSMDILTTISSGTLFLRGIEDLGPDVQAALLDLLDRRSDLRVISSSRRTLSALSAVIRDDLLYRLVGTTVELPPLRFRADFGWLLDRLMRPHPEHTLTPAARAELQARAWPGNIRELERTLDVATALAETSVIDLVDLPPPGIQAKTQNNPDEQLEAVLAAAGWNMAQAARRLGLNRSTILRRVRKAGLLPPR